MNAETSNPYQTPELVDDAPATLALSGFAEVNYASLKWTASGLTLMYFAILLQVIGCLLFIPLEIIFRTTVQLNLQFVLQICVIVLVVGPLFMLQFGPVLCLGSPAGTGLRPLAGLTVAITFMAWMSQLGLVIGLPLVGAWFFAIYLLMPLASAVFLAFLFRLARLMSREDLARRCRKVFVIGFLFYVLAFGLSLLGAALPVGAVVGILIAVGIALLGICVFVAYANLINSTRLAIQRPMESQRFVGLM